MRKIIISFLLVSFGFSGFAAEVDSAKAQGLINAFRTCGFAGIISGTTFSYNFDIKCARFDNLNLASSDPSFALSTYNCDVGAGKLVAAKAQVLFEAAENAFGSTAGEGKTLTEAKNLQCVLHLDTAEAASRFTCTKD